MVTDIERETGDTNLGLISQAPLEKCRSSMWAPEWGLDKWEPLCVSGWEQQQGEFKAPPLGFGDGKHHRARHRLWSPHRCKGLSSGRKVPPRTKPFSSVCWTHGSGEGQEIKVPSPTLTCLLPFPLSCFCSMVIWNSSLIGCSGFFPSQSGTTTHFTDKETETCPKGTPVGESELASPNVQQVANSRPLSKTPSVCAQTNACMAV